MIKITFKINFPVDVTTLLGNITISDGLKSINDEDTIIESWISALILALPEISSKRITYVDLIDEPDDVVIENIGQAYTMEYNKQSISFKSIQDLEYVLKKASIEILNLFPVEENFGANQQLIVIRNYAYGRNVPPISQPMV